MGCARRGGVSKLWHSHRKFWSFRQCFWALPQEESENNQRTQNCFPSAPPAARQAGCQNKLSADCFSGMAPILSDLALVALDMLCLGTFLCECRLFWRSVRSIGRTTSISNRTIEQMVPTSFWVALIRVECGWSIQHTRHGPWPSTRINLPMPLKVIRASKIIDKDVQTYGQDKVGWWHGAPVLSLGLPNGGDKVQPLTYVLEHWEHGVKSTSTSFKFMKDSLMMFGPLG